MAYPTSGINIEHRFNNMIFNIHARLSSCHDCAIQDKECDELADFDDIARPWYNQSVLVQQRRSSGIVEGDWSLLPSVWNDVDEAVRRINQFPSIYGIDHFLTSTTCQEAFAAADDSNFKSSEFPLNLAAVTLLRPVHGVQALLADLIGSALEWLKAGDEDVGKFEKASWTRVMFVVPTEDLFSNEFAEESACEVDCLMVGCE